MYYTNIHILQITIVCKLWSCHHTYKRDITDNFGIQIMELPHYETDDRSAGKEEQLTTDRKNRTDTKGTIKRKLQSISKEK